MKTAIMSPLLLLLVGLAAITTPSQAQDNCGLPYTTPAASRRGPQPTRPRRQAVPSPANAAPPSTSPGPVPYSSCGAVVVSDRFVLTAAYCVIDPSNPVNSVRLGDLDLSEDGEVNSRPADYDIELIVVHPNFTHNPESQIRYNDLALLKTARRIEFNEVVFPYCISRNSPALGATVIASGFGYVNETHKPTHLQEGDLKVMSPADCEAEYRAKGKEAILRRAYPDLLQGYGVVCAGETGKGACRGDEGGPLLRKDASGRRHLEGILSFTGDMCGPDVLPSVSVSIADNYDFIVDTINSF